MTAHRRQRGATRRVFVYGTLLAGEPNHGLLAQARFVAEGRTRPSFELRDLGAFPGLVAAGLQSVVGEVYEVDAATLAALDRLEGHPRFYRRMEITLEDGLEVETYLLTPEQGAAYPIIESGSWRASRRRSDGRDERRSGWLGDVGQRGRMRGVTGDTR